MPISLAKYRREVKSTPAHNHNAETIEPSLPLPDGVTTSPNALVCSRELTIDEWKSLGCMLWQRERSIQWWLGDWWHYGEHRYGARAMATAKDAFGRDYAFGTLMNWGYVAGRVATSLRNEVLSWSHHYAVAALEPKEQERWLDIAARDKLSVAKLRDKMFEDKHPGGKFTEDEKIRRYLYWLENAAQRAAPACVLDPWKDGSLEQYLERCNPLWLARLAKKFEEVATFWSKTAQFVRWIEESSKLKRAKSLLRSSDLDESHRSESNGNSNWTVDEMETCG